jgi:hypothetical protein
MVLFCGPSVKASVIIWVRIRLVNGGPDPVGPTIVIRLQVDP